MPKNRTSILVASALACAMWSPTASAQRSESPTADTRTTAPSTDLTCTMRGLKKVWDHAWDAFPDLVPFQDQDTTWWRIGWHPRIFVLVFVHNRGRIPVKVATTVRAIKSVYPWPLFLIDGTPNRDAYTVSLQPNDSTLLARVYPEFTSGWGSRFTVTANVDSGKDVTESVETNNLCSIRFTLNDTDP